MVRNMDPFERQRRLAMAQQSAGVGAVKITSNREERE